ncbi:uncharacterized protein MONOS_6886 [Monocercomonoides exilis]|uniref:uncharacterized protein n=1 Tax=Monocercomonoides exilis TaxID=2049356 RepID=UPI003559F3E0|nr:hypothetical protein MONOS_6886 [Monocercomonoides exilis]|eukprot:MONOS_6886.1-p1 / transcript=MONOS_6886.1 / gene=MONOS_6886 / organism=Monocercomonoides_exilis_PA203 / gene_product=unspecified product / transcript_product=unspecified product / location=Mono_scaffold00225:57180-58364(+) / protein_length=395 / sequence_SO=supercontig / SO=protein_coding / is_pseudo=false
MDNYTLFPAESQRFQPILKFSETLPELQKQKLMEIFENTESSFPSSNSLEEFARSLPVGQNALFWNAVNECSGASECYLQKKQLPFIETKDAPKVVIGHIWEASYVAPILDKNGVPSRNLYTSLMFGYERYLTCLRSNEKWNKSTQTQLNLAKKAIRTDMYLHDRSLEEDQKAVITEFKRISQREFNKAKCHMKYHLSAGCVNFIAIILFLIGLYLIAMTFIFASKMSNELVTLFSIVGLICMCLFSSICVLSCVFNSYFDSIGLVRYLSNQAFDGELKKVMRPCVEKRVENWKRQIMWRWLLCKSELKIEWKIDEMEEKEKNSKEIVLSGKEEEELRRLEGIQAMAISGCSGNGKEVEADRELLLPKSDNSSFNQNSANASLITEKEEEYSLS